MRRFPWIVTLLIPVVALAQGAPPGGTPTPAAPAGHTRDAAQPAEASPNGPAAAPTAAPAGTAPASSTTVPAGTGKKLTLRVPSGSEYTAYIQEAATAAPKSFQDNVELEIPADLKAAT